MCVRYTKKIGFPHHLAGLPGHLHGGGGAGGAPDWRRNFPGSPFFHHHPHFPPHMLVPSSPSSRINGNGKDFNLL